MKLIKHWWRLLFGKKVEAVEINRIVKDIVNYTVASADSFVRDFRRAGFQVDHQDTILRREAIAFFAQFAARFQQMYPDQKQPFSDLIKALGEKVAAFSADLVQVDGPSKVVSLPDGSAPMTFMPMKNLLAATIDDRIRYYARREAISDSEFLPATRDAFAWAHLVGGEIGDLSVEDIHERLRKESGTDANVVFPDNIRDDFVVDWFATAINPINSNFQDLLYVARYLRLP